MPTLLMYLMLSNVACGATERCAPLATLKVTFAAGVSGGTLAAKSYFSSLGVSHRTTFEEVSQGTTFDGFAIAKPYCDNSLSFIDDKYHCDNCYAIRDNCYVILEYNFDNNV